MKNKILLIFAIFTIILAISVYTVYNYRMSVQESQKVNNEYKAYYNTQVIGTELISIINKTEDINEKYGIEKDEDGLYIENDTDSIKIYIEVKYSEEYRTLEMEKIISNGIENFIKVYSTANFECSEITYHDKTNNVKSLTFTEVDETIN